MSFLPTIFLANCHLTYSHFGLLSFYSLSFWPIVIFGIGHFGQSSIWQIVILSNCHWLISHLPNSSSGFGILANCHFAPRILGKLSSRPIVYRQIVVAPKKFDKQRFGWNIFLDEMHSGNEVIVVFTWNTNLTFYSNIFWKNEWSSFKWF